MKSFICTLLLLVLGIPGYASLYVNRVAGTVEVYVTESVGWSSAEVGMQLGESGKIKTGANGRSELTFDTGTKVWIRENSECELSALEQLTARGGTSTEFTVTVGKVRAKVKLPKKGVFTIRTPASVCAVRGTDLAVFVTPEATQLLVFEGNVEQSNVASDELTVVKGGETCQSNTNGETSAAREMNATEQSLGKENWNEPSKVSLEPGSTEKETAKETGKTEPAKSSEPSKQESTTDSEVDPDTEISAGLSPAEELRQELQTFVAEAKNDIVEIRELTREVREQDFAAGRSLRDVHGNLVRVEQKMLRPDAQTLQFVNLTKRDDYVYNGKWSYTGPTGPRIDALTQTVRFNLGIPDQITDWPVFFKDNGKNIKLESMGMTVTNQVDKIEITGTPVTKTVTETFTNYDQYGKPTGMTTFTRTEDDMDAKIYVNGREVVKDTELTTEQKNIQPPKETNGDKEAWVAGEGPVWLKDSNAPTDRNKDTLVWMQFEMYGINNEGKILTEDFIKSGDGKDPFTLLREIAGENIVTARVGDRLNLTYRGDVYFQRGNIDLVYTPDIFIQLATKMLTVATELIPK